MSTHYKWYPGSEEVIVPWNARYAFPSQANKAVKTTPRIPPKNGATFAPGNTIRFELPAQGYINSANTTLSFDVILTGYGYGAEGSRRGLAYFQNNIQSIFNRVRLLYGATPLEDMINYNQIVRNLTEWTSSSNTVFDQTSVTEGVGRNCITCFSGLTGQSVNARIAYVQSVNNPTVSTSTVVPTVGPTANSSVRRYQVQLALGTLTQGKLLPAKFMASQLAIEITLEQPVGCIIGLSDYNGGGTATTTPTFTVTNLNLIPEILEFDSSYDAMFLKGLQEGGVPIKFSTWHTFQFTQGASTIGNYQIQERSRSIKSIFTVVRAAIQAFANDAGATLGGLVSDGVLNYYQYRIGGRYFPAAPVICSNYQTSPGTPNGATEAFIELQKALNTLGDYRLSTGVNAMTWGDKYREGGTGVTLPSSVGESDGFWVVQRLTTAINITANDGVNFGSSPTSNQCFCMAINLETSNGAEISGLNAEEQSDISLMCQWSAAPTRAMVVESYVLFDSMIILRPNNVLELIQ
jgi:hypothetical protein